MNYRIDRIDRLVSGKDSVIFSISGRLHGRALATLRELLGKERGKLAMDLKEVTLVDRDSVLFLALVEAQGNELRNCPAYIREWIDRERPAQ